MATSFLDLVDAVGAYYGTGSDEWNIIARNGIGSPESIAILQQVPGVNLTVSNSGKILGYDYSNPFGTSIPPAAAINSNAQSGTYGAESFTSNIPSSAIPPSTETPNGGMSSGAKLSGVGSTVATIADRVSLGIAGVALGTKLGMLIDSGIYALNPNWFDENFPAMNPQTWDDMATTQGGKQFIRSLFGLNNDDNSATMYIDERLLAQMYMVLRENGAYASGEAEVPADNPLNVPAFNFSTGMTGGAYMQNKEAGGSYNFAQVYYGFETATLFHSTRSGGTFTVLLASASDISNKEVAAGSNENPFALTPSPMSVVNPYTYDGKTVYHFLTGNFGGALVNKEHETNISTDNGYFSSSVLNANYPKMAWLMIYGGYAPAGGLDGVSENANASTHIDPNIVNGDDLATVLQQLQTNYPQLFTGGVYTDVPQPDGTIERINYIPVPYPNTTNINQPVSDNTPNIDPQTNPQVNPQTRPDAAQDIATETTTPTTNSPTTGDGNSPTVITPTGGASSLWAVYNPTQAQVDAFGAWLWSSNFVEQIKKLFSDPMQGIIGLHKIFATPATGAAQNIKVGYLDSGVSSAVVTNQYTDIDCGTVNVAEYFGNVFDYDGTNIRAYLPFIGIVELSTSDVMRGAVHIVYHVDVITGACLADVIVSRDGAGGVLYQYSGDAAVRYPVSSGSYMGMVSGVLAVVGGVVGAMTGGAALPAVMGAVGGVMNSHTSVKHSGSFSGAAGAMGAKVPYLIIERPQTAVANDYVNYQGIGDNRVVNVGSLAGYFRMTDVHTNSVVGATGEEIEEIRTMLERGVIQ